MASTDSRVPLLDLAPLHGRLRKEIDAAIKRVIDGNDFILGKAVHDFEAHAARYLNVRHAIGVASGTDALLLALKAAGIGEGDEVVIPAFSFFATVEAVLHAGAIPVFADIEPHSMNIDPAGIEAVLTPQTRAIVPVHLFGQMADMHAIEKIAARHRLIVIEDVAQAFGATLQGRFAGSFGRAGCFSFHPTKPLGGMGDGGLVTTSDDSIAKTIRELRDHGSATRYHHVRNGYNSRLDGIQAAVLDVKLRDLDRHLEERNRLAENYRAMLTDLPLQLPEPLPDRRHCHAQFTLRLTERERTRDALMAANVATAVHYPAPLYRQPALAKRYAGLHLPVAETTCNECLSLPLYEGLSREQQQHVADVLRSQTLASDTFNARSTARGVPAYPRPTTAPRATRR